MIKHKAHTIFRQVLPILLMLLCVNGLFAQSKPTRFLFLFDCSGSMWGDMDGKKTRIAVAKQTLERLVDSLKTLPNIEMGLRSFGAHGSKEKEDCRDTRKEVAFAHDNAKSIKKGIDDLEPNGTTPIAFALTQAAIDFPATPGNNIIILITDGIEECKGDPCAVSQALQNSGIILRPFIIGLGLKEDWAKQYQCVGRFYNTNTEDGLQEVLGMVVSQALNNTTLCVNLNDLNGKAVETNVNMTFYNSKSSEIIYNFYHTMSSEGRPDTFTADPGQKYDIEVHTTPPVFQRNIELKPAQHNTVNITAPQGTLNLHTNSFEYFLPQCIVTRPGTAQTVNVQQANTSQRYLAGTYDLEILTLPRLRYKDFKIVQHETKTIEIPEPGRLDLKSVRSTLATIFQVKGETLEWVTDLTSTEGMQSFYLLPGNYMLLIRASSSREIHDTRETKFTISAGSTTSLTLK